MVRFPEMPRLEDDDNFVSMGLEEYDLSFWRQEVNRGIVPVYTEEELDNAANEEDFIRMMSQIRAQYLEPVYIPNPYEGGKMVVYRNMNTTPPKPGCWERYKNKRNRLIALKRLRETRRGKKSSRDSDAVPTGDLTEQKLELERPPSGSIDLGIEDKPGLENAPPDVGIQGKPLLDVAIEGNPTLESLPSDSVDVGVDKAVLKGSPFDQLNSWIGGSSGLQGSPPNAPTVYVGNLGPEREPSVVEGSDSRDVSTSLEKEAVTEEAQVKALAVTKEAQVKALDKKRKSVMLSPGPLKKKNKVDSKIDKVTSLLERLLGMVESGINGAMKSVEKGVPESALKGEMASLMQTLRAEVESYVTKEKNVSVILSCSSSDEEFST